MSRALAIRSSREPARIAPERTIARAADGLLPRYITAEEARALIAAAETPRDRMLLATLWNTGGRISEVLALRRSDFDPSGLSLRMLNEKQGRYAEKIVYVCQAFALELLTYCDANGLRGGDLLFTSRTRRPLDRTAGWRIVQRAALKADVRAYCHLFRHGNAVHLVRNGVPLSVVKSQLGHASILTTMVYQRLSEADKRQMVSGVTF